jgi:hypothetical protein
VACYRAIIVPTRLVAIKLLTKKPILPSDEIRPKQTADQLSLLGQRGAAMFNIINLLYREYCLARLSEMRQFQLYR